MVQPRKTKRRWDPAKAKRWGEKQKARNALKRAEADKNRRLGIDPSHAGGADLPGSVAPGPGPGNKPNNNESGPGTYDLPPDAHPPNEEETPGSTKTPLDLEAVWASLPEFWKMVVLGLQNWADVFNWSQKNIYLIFVPLNDKEAKTLAAFSRPFLEAKLPEWIRKNPGLALCCVPLFILLFKVRITFKRPKGDPKQSVIDVTPENREAA